jgi:hypothetical protein
MTGPATEMIPMKRVPALAGYALLLIAAAGSHGCRWGEHHPEVEPASLIDGVSVLAFDGLNVYVKRAASDATGPFLVVNGRIVEDVKLRVGDGFVITDGRSVHTAYHLLAANDDRITFKREKVLDRYATREGIKTEESVIAVRPYNSEDAD